MSRPLEMDTGSIIEVITWIDATFGPTDCRDKIVEALSEELDREAAEMGMAYEADPRERDE